jgi:hypothetical protein
MKKFTFFTKCVDEDLHGANRVTLETGLAPLRFVLRVEVQAILGLISTARKASGTLFTSISPLK